jgi:prepilin-type N-terminal cleavage/methylation domain-containing protein
MILSRRDLGSLEKDQQGFSLTELAISLAVIGLLVLAVPRLIEPVRHLLSKSQGVAVQDASDLLLGFVLVNNRLPCPAPAARTNGKEDCTADNDNGLMPWKTLGLPGPLLNSHGLDFRYGVYRHSNNTAESDSDLAVLINRFEPYLPPKVNNSITHTKPTAPDISALGGAMIYPVLPTKPEALPTPSVLLRSVVQTNYTNGLDFCLALRNATKSAIGATKVNAGINVAFVVADPGVIDADNNLSLVSVFDGKNSAGVTFELPSRGISSSYDDRVLAIGFAELAGTLGCPAAVANVNAAARAAWVAYDEYRAAVFYAYLRDFIYTVRQTNLQVNKFNYVFSSTSLAITLAQTATDIAVGAGSFSGAVIATVIGVTLSVYESVTAALQLQDAKDANELETLQLTAAWIQVTNAGTREEAMRLFSEEQYNNANNSDNRGLFQ